MFLLFFTRISKHRLSLAQTTQQMPEALKLVRTCNLKLNDGNHLSTFEELQVGHENKSDEIAQHFTQMRVILLNFLLCQGLLFQ